MNIVSTFKEHSSALCKNTLRECNSCDRETCIFSKAQFPPLAMRGGGLHSLQSMLTPGFCVVLYFLHLDQGVVFTIIIKGDLLGLDLVQPNHCLGRDMQIQQLDEATSN